MLHVTRRSLGSPAWLAIALVLLLPTLSQAQLFPNRTIRRQRPPCATEPPFNGQVRRDYFGYYPTCWSRFPAGWACPCPNPELPNRDASIRKYGEFGAKKPGLEPEAGLGMGDENPDEPGLRPPGPDAPNNIPLPNGGRSPFELDPNPQPPGGAAPPAGPDGDPFTSPNAPNPRPTNPLGRPSAGALEMPKMPEITPSTSSSDESPLLPGSIAMTPDATLASGTSAEVRPDLGPLPSAEPGPVSIPNDLTSPSRTSLGQPVPLTPAPAQAPRRQSILGKLFGSKDTRNR